MILRLKDPKEIVLTSLNLFLLCIRYEVECIREIMIVRKRKFGYRHHDMKRQRGDGWANQFSKNIL